MTARSLSHNTLFLLIGNVGGVTLAFLISVLIGRTQGEIGLGVYSVVLAWIFSLSMLVDAGFNTLLTRDLAQNVEYTADYLRVAAVQRLLVGGTAAFALLAFAPVFSDNQAVTLGLRLSAPLLLIEPFLGLFTAVFRARQVMLPVALLNIGMLLLQVILIAWAFSAGWGIQAALVINVLTSFCRLLAAWLIYRAYFYVDQPASGVSLWSLFWLALPFALAALLSAIQQRLGILQLEWFSNLQQVGFYAAALRFIDAGRMLPQAFYGALFPVLSELAAKPHDLNKLLNRAMLGLLLFALAGAAAGMVAAEPLLRLTYGQSFTAAAPVLAYGLWLLLPGVVRALLTLYWYSQKQVAFANTVVAVMIITQLILGWWVIPHYGAVGLIAVMMVVETLAALVMSRTVGRALISFFTA